MNRSRIFAVVAIVALAIAGVAAAANTVFPLQTHSAASWVYSSTVAIGDTLSLTKTGGTNAVTSATSAATMTSSVAAFTLSTTATPDANDLLLRINNAAGTQKLACDAEGDFFLAGDATLAGNDLTFSGTGATGKITCAANDSTTSATVAACTIAASVNVTDGDLVLDVQNSAGDHLITVDEQGKVTSLTKLVSTTDIDLAGNDFTATGTAQTFNIVSNTADSTTSGTVGSITLKAGAAITATDLILDVQDSSANHRLTCAANGNTVVGGTFTATGASTLTGAVAAASNVTVAGKVIASVQAVSVADSGNGSSAPDTLTPTSTYVRYTCNDADTCPITISETGAVDGQLLYITNVGTNAITFADTSGVTETTGAISLGQYDSLAYIYASDRWIEIGTVNN